MNFLEHEAELLDILYFTEVISLRDIKEYWALGEDIGLLDFRNIDDIELLYESDMLKISCGNVQNTFQALKRAKKYILFLLEKNKLSGDLSKKIVNIKEFYGLFSKDEVLKILFTAERYTECEQYYYSHLPNFADCNQACAIWQQVLAKSGNYKLPLNIQDADFEVCLSAMRYLWQKGAFADAEKIAARLEGKFDALKAFQKAQFLNTRIRILRDMGRIKDTDAALNLFYSLLEPISVENPEVFSDLKGKYLYNCSINHFIAGDFARCLSLCRDSLPLRSEKYPDPYIKLRQARCFVFQGNRKNYNSLMKEIQVDTLDNWAKSLHKTVEAEYARFVLGNTQRAERLIKESNEIEAASGADTVYTDIALLYLYIQCGRKSEIRNLLPTIKSYQQYVDGQLAFLTAKIALKFLNGEYVDPLIFNLCNEFHDYPIFLFVSLYSLSKLFEQQNGVFPDIRDHISFGSRFSRKLLSVFDYQPKPEVSLPKAKQPMATTTGKDNQQPLTPNPTKISKRKKNKFSIGITFTGTHRKRVEAIAKALLKIGFEKENIFYDDWHDSLINGLNADLTLQDIYRKKCACIVVFLSTDYNKKAWTGGVEWRAIRNIIINAKGKGICLLNVDGVDINKIDGLSSYTDIAKKIESLTDDQVAQFIKDFMEQHNI